MNTSERSVEIFIWVFAVHTSIYILYMLYIYTYIYSIYVIYVRVYVCILCQLIEYFLFFLFTTTILCDRQGIYYFIRFTN